MHECNRWLSAVLQVKHTHYKQGNATDQQDAKNHEYQHRPSRKSSNLA